MSRSASLADHLERARIGRPPGGTRIARVAEAVLHVGALHGAGDVAGGAGSRRDCPQVLGQEPAVVVTAVAGEQRQGADARAARGRREPGRLR